MTTVLVTAGPTREYLDGVRYLANASSGRMGFAIAGAAAARGLEVRLVAGPTELEPPRGVPVERVVSARDMHEAALRAFEGADIAFGVAAVADFRPSECAAGKPAKEAAKRTLELVENPDVIASLGAIKGSRTVVGFALEVGAPAEVLGRARRKLERKHLDMCVLNTAEAMGAVDNAVTLVWRDGRVEELPRATKEELGRELVDRVLAWRERQGGAS